MDEPINQDSTNERSKLGSALAALGDKLGLTVEIVPDKDLGRLVKFDFNKPVC